MPDRTPEFLASIMETVEGQDLIPALEHLLAVTVQQSRRCDLALAVSPTPEMLSMTSSVKGMAAGLRLAVTLAHERALEA